LLVNVIPGTGNTIWSQDRLPKHWIRPFGILLQENRQPHYGEFGIAFMAHLLPNGTLDKRFMFGQILGIEREKYRFLTPSYKHPDARPMEYLLSPQRFAPAYVNAEHGIGVPRVPWALANSTTKHLPDADHENARPAKGLTEKLKVRIDRARRKCDADLVAQRLLKELSLNLSEMEYEREALLRKPLNEKQLFKAYGKWQEERDLIRRRLAHTHERASDHGCSEAIGEALVQEEADHCRKWIVDHAIERENKALREIIEHGPEAQARNAVESLLIPYEELSENRDFIRKARNCSSKIRSPLERLSPAPRHASGTSAIERRRLMERCGRSAAAQKIGALLASRNENDFDWEEVMEILDSERAQLGAFLDAHHCREALREWLAHRRRPANEAANLVK
jgi:hypothetical protein